MRQDTPAIRVNVREAASGRDLGTVSVPASDLPDTFLVETTMHLGDQALVVARADPPLKRDFLRTGRLTIRVRPVKPSPPPAGTTLVFPVPTIENAQPVSTGGSADGSEVVLHEDDWRQIEFVAGQYSTLLDAELAAVRSTIATKSTPHGFSDVHLRSSLDAPLAVAALPIAAISRTFGVRARRLRIGGQPNRVTGGFAIGLGGPWIVYGVQGDGRIHALGLDARRGDDGTELDAATWIRRRTEGTDRPRIAPEGIAALSNFIAAHGLALVDWCRARRHDGGAASLDALFGPGR